MVDFPFNELAIVEYKYTADRRDAGYTVSLANGTVVERDVVRDVYRRSLVTGISSKTNGVPLQGYSYAYDALGRPVSRNADAFSYNARSEVVEAFIGDVGEYYDYDEAGNRIGSARNGDVTWYSANVNNQYTSLDYSRRQGHWIHHDTDGNLLSDGTLAFTYDADNRLKTVSLNGVTLVVNAYDARSRRVRKTTPEAATTYFYDDWNLVEENVAWTNGASTIIRYYWGKDLSGTLGGAGGVGGLLATQVGGAWYFPAYDANGNITQYVDEDGHVVASYTYDAFGNTVSESGSMSSVFPFRFSTKYYDSESGLFYYGYRFYSPKLGRWLTRDPIEEAGGVNLYGFCGNEPVFAVDGLGHFAIYVHTDGLIGHVGLRTLNGTTYDYGRYLGTYSGLGFVFPGPNVLRTNQWESVKSTHAYKVFDFKVCKVLDDSISKAAAARFSKGLAKRPEGEKFKKIKQLEVNERYMESDWSWNRDNCMTFTFHTIVDGMREAQDNGQLSPMAKRQAKILLKLAFDSCWQLSPYFVSDLLERYADASDWISVSNGGIK